MWDFDHIGDFADELDTEAVRDRTDNYVINKASDDGNCHVLVLGMSKR